MTGNDAFCITFSVNMAKKGRTYEIDMNEGIITIISSRIFKELSQKG